MQQVRQSYAIQLTNPESAETQYILLAERHSPQHFSRCAAIRRCVTTSRIKSSLAIGPWIARGSPRGADADPGRQRACTHPSSCNRLQLGSRGVDAGPIAAMARAYTLRA